MRVLSIGTRYVHRRKRLARKRLRAMRKRNRNAGWFLLLSVLTSTDDPRGRLLRSLYEDDIAATRARFVDRLVFWRRGPRGA